MTEAKQKRTDLSLQEKHRILERYDELPKMSQRSAAVRLKISQPLLCKILKKRLDIEFSALSNKNMDRKRERSGKDSELESALKRWFSDVRRKNTPVSGPILRQKAEELAKAMGNEDFIATDGWFNRWKRRENITYKSVRRKEKSGDLLAANGWTSNEVSESLEEDERITEEEILEVPPTDAQMREALRTLRRGVQCRARNFEKHYEYENYIRQLMSANERRAR